jgi:hypothetical protein
MVVIFLLATSVPCAQTATATLFGSVTGQQRGAITCVTIHVRNLRIGEGHPVQFRAERFNLPNHPNLGQPSATVGATDFGYISSAEAGRQIQFALRYDSKGAECPCH